MTTLDYWTTSATVASTGKAGPGKESRRVINWRLMLALGLNVAAWAVILTYL